MDRDTLKLNFLNRNNVKFSQRIMLKKDASHRQYERITTENESMILMDAPPKKEKVESFVYVADLLLQNNMSAPKILHSDIENGFLLLEDFGDNSFTNILSGKVNVPSDVTETTIYEKAIDNLIHLHKISPNGTTLGLYNETTLIQESMRFINYYLSVSNGEKPSQKDQDEFVFIMKHLLRSAKAALNSSVIVLRDYHADNLMWLDDRAGLEKVGLLDFQDAVIGSPVYDLVSLLEDARRDVGPQIVEKMLHRYLQAFPNYSHKNFAAAYAIFGIQRNLKIIGVFARQASFYRNPQYLTYLPRVWRHINHDLKHPLLLPLKNWLMKIIPAQIRSN